MAMRLTVTQDNAGSTPVTHPTYCSPFGIDRTPNNRYLAILVECAKLITWNR